VWISRSAAGCISPLVCNHVANDARFVIRFGRTRELPVRDASVRTPANEAGELYELRLRITARGPKEILPGTIICLALAVYLLVEAFEPFSVFRLALAIAIALLAIRMAKCWTLAVGDGHIEWHTALRTRRWLYSEVDRFELAVRSSGSEATAVRVLRMHMANGRAQWMNRLQEPASPDIAGGSVHATQSYWPDSRWATISDLWPPQYEAALDDVVAQLNSVVTDVGKHRAVREAG